MSDRPPLAVAVPGGQVPPTATLICFLLPAGTWQRMLPAARDALVSCLVSPGFDVDDCELG